MATRFDEWRLKMTDNVQSNLRKMSAGADHVAARFSRVQDRLSKWGGQTRQAGAEVFAVMRQSVSDFKDNLIGALPIPGAMGSALSALTGPLAVAVGLAGGLGLAFTKGLEAAEAYGKPFRELRNLNQDKSVAEMEALNERVLNLASAKGLDASKLVTGVYDVQSTIGEFGPAVEQMVADVGVAARALNMDFGTAVNGVGKALVQFKLPLSDVNRLLESNAKTVQVGVVTFDELSKVQTEFAGAASSMNQELDTANKVFALLTTNTKNADIAATMTKAAFQDLGKADTIAGLKKIGVNVFDANGKMRQTDAILRELVPKLGMMSDATFAKLKEEIGGSEGLRGLLDMTKASGSEVLRVLDSFDNTKFSVAEAIREANNDLDVMSEKVDGELTAAWTRLGQAIAPVWIEMKRGFSEAINGMLDGVGYLGKMLKFNFGSPKEQAAIVAKEQSAAREKMLAAYQGGFDRLSADQKRQQLDKLRNQQNAAEYDLKTKAGSMTREQLAKLKQDMGMRSALLDRLSSKQQVPTGKPGTSAPTADPMAALFAEKGKKKGGSNLTEGVNAVSGGGKSVRNVTITIESLVKELKVMSAGGVKESAADIQRLVTEALVRAVQGGELMLSND